MRILLLTPFLPDPGAPHGGGSYLGALAEGLSQSAELGLVHLAHPSEAPATAPPWHWCRSAPYQGLPAGDSGGRHRARMMWRWLRRPLLAAKHWQPQLPALLAQARSEFRPDVVMVELAQMAQYLPYLQDLPSVLTDHEAGRPANAGTGLGSRADRRDTALWRRYLHHHYRSASLLQALTAADAQSLSHELGREVLVRPPAMPLPPVAASPGLAPPRALFLGDYRHRPNREAAERLVRDVLPALRKQAPVELWLAGANDDAIRHLDGSDGVRLCGFVADLHSLLADVRLVLAPLWSGRGFRVKVATALAHGVPVVTNALGARGCEAPEPACSIAETGAELAASATRLLASPELAAEAGKQARRWAIEHLSAAAVAELQLARLDALLGGRQPT